MNIPFNYHEAEADIENLDIAAIERNSGETVLIMKAEENSDIWIRCSVEKHNDFVRRFRKKLKLI